MRKRYSVTPSQRRKSWIRGLSLCIHRNMPCKTKSVRGVRKRHGGTHRRRAYHMIIRHNPQLPPTIHHRQQTQMIIRRPLLRHLPQRKPIQHLIPQQQILPIPSRCKHRRPRRPNPLLQLRPMPAQHQLEQLSYRFRILPYLRLSRRVQDRQASINMPLVRINPKCDIRLDIFNPPHIPARLPRKLVIRTPRRAHAQKRRVRDRLRVGGDAVVGFGGEVHVLGAEAG